MKKDPPKLIILVGNIGTGKSTLCRQYVKRGYYILSRDSLRYMIGGGEYIFNPTFEPTIADGTIELLRTFLSSGWNIVLDEVNISQSIRAPYIKMAKRYGYTVIGVIMPKYSQEFCVQRRLSNPHGQYSKKLWGEVWDRFNTLYEYPSISEGFDRLIRRRPSRR